MKPFRYMPFQSINIFLKKDIISYKFFINIVCNIILFIPFGFLGISFKKFKQLNVLAPIFLICISCMELIQYLTGRGYGEIDDIILNSIGMLIGFFMFKRFLLIRNSNLETQN